MAIATYSDLQAKLTTYSWREGDVSFGDETADMVRMAESRLNRVLPLRVGETDVTLTGAIGSRMLTLPSNYKEPLRLQRVTDGQFYEMEAFVADDLPMSSVNATPSRYAIDGEAIKLGCPCDQAYTFLFRYRGSLALSDAAPTNWLLTNHPDIYLAACCVWGGFFMRDGDLAAQSKALLDEAVNELGWLDSRSRAVAPLRVDPGLTQRRPFNILTGRY